MERLTRIAPQGFAVDGVRAPTGEALIGWTISDEDGWRVVDAVANGIVTTMDKHGNEREEDLERVRRIAEPPYDGARAMDDYARLDLTDGEAFLS